MKKAKDIITPDQIIEIILRRRWYIILPFIVSMIAGIFYTTTLTKVYEARTLILIQAQRVPENYVQAIVDSDTSSRLNTLSQQIMSRTNLEKIIKDFRLFAEPQYENVFMEEKIESLRRKISIDITRDRRGADAFSISYRGGEPEKVMKVANGLARYFIDENLKVREAQAFGTSDFLDDELNNMRLKLEEVEEVLKQYRSRYMGELPEQLETNLRILRPASRTIDRQTTSLAGRQSPAFAHRKSDSEFQGTRRDTDCWHPSCSHPSFRDGSIETATCRSEDTLYRQASGCGQFRKNNCRIGKPMNLKTHTNEAQALQSNRLRRLTR